MNEWEPAVAPRLRVIAPQNKPLPPTVALAALDLAPAAERRSFGGWRWLMKGEQEAHPWMTERTASGLAACRLLCKLRLLGDPSHRPAGCPGRRALLPNA